MTALSPVGVCTRCGDFTNDAVRINGNCGRRLGCLARDSGAKADTPGGPRRARSGSGPVRALIGSSAQLGDVCFDAVHRLVDCGQC